MEEEPAGSGPGIDGIGQALEVDTLLLKFADKID